MSTSTNLVPTDLVSNYLRENEMGVLGYNGACGPSSALIAYAELGIKSIVFESMCFARKTGRLRHESQTSLVIVDKLWRHVTLQMEGITKPMYGKDFDRAIELFVNKRGPCSSKFFEDKKVRFFKMDVLWLRYSDYTGNAPVIMENEYGDLRW